MRALLVATIAVAAGLLPSVALASVDAGVWACKDAVRVSKPLDGATNQRTDIAIELYYLTFCAGEPSGVALFDSAGNEVPTDLLTGPPMALRPRADLAPGTYEVRMAGLGPPRCGNGPSPTLKSRFTVGPAPGVRQIEFPGGVYLVSFSEPVAAAAKDQVKAYVGISGPDPSEAYFQPSMDELYWGFKGLGEAAMPSPDTEVTIHISKDLPFESGVTMAQDFDVKLVPAEWRTWKPGLERCPGADAGSDAGTQAPPSNGGCGSAFGGATSLVVAGLALALLARRRPSTSPR